MELQFNDLPKAVTELQQTVNNIERMLLIMANAPQAEADQMLTIQQASELLQLTVPTLYVKVHHREIPVSKQGNRLYFSKQELLEWVKLGRRKTIAETAVEAEAFLSSKSNRSKK